MTRSIKRSALASLMAGSMVLAACSETDSTSNDSKASDATAIEGLTGATGELVAEGASSQQNAMNYFANQYQAAVPGATLAYNATGSGSGVKNFIAGQVAFGGSDSPLKEDQIEPAKERCGGNEAWHLPMVIGPVAVAYHLDGVDDLNLSTKTVAKIFKGDITKWNDDEIAKENEGKDLPDKDIKVVYRSDESGTSDNFQKFLKASTGEWDTEGKSFPSKVGAGASGSNGVASEVANIDGGITYVESGFAKQQNLGIANLDFGSGPVKLDPDTVGVALENLEFTTEGNNMVVDTEKLFGSKDEGAYPLVLTTYELVCSKGYEDNTRDQVKDFLTVALNSQDEQLEELGYIPVKGSLHDRLQKAVDAIS
ncbi:phosphate ABC transporter substrate-binding protein PstS [Corynebacterium pseudopelargi]|uniref:Phosphate-binding protein n=1 Tax=Corynebacterium pseudopelargi TaxID=2080757 RepID=A0A3G6ISS1_9CORY|nr:phosphate ABC transporter substrate-binding protein PstS [Corynebacterium pseudopelargi]AZA08557.1 Phosphate-binding protein PstS 3 precursor [Corynebacterium pseudopelargi]